MTNTSSFKLILDTYSVKEKVQLLKELYQDISGYGINGDEELAHVNSLEAGILKSLGGSGTLNDVTGLPQYFGGGEEDDEATRTTVEKTRLPTEIAPFAQDLLTDAQKLYRHNLEKGMPVYDAPRIAPLTPDQLASQEGLRALVGTSGPLHDEALELYRKGTEKFADLSPEELETYMSPYQRAKTDVEKREAQRDFESKIMPQFEKQAAGHGAMSGLGTRAGIQAAELGRSQMQRLGDIEARGLQSAYMDAQNLYKEGQASKRLAAQDISKAAPARFASGLSEQGLLKDIGQEDQALAQSALDQAYARFREKRDYPRQQLEDYSKFVYGNPLMSQRDKSTITPPKPSSTGKDLLSLGASAASMYATGGMSGMGGMGGMMSMFGGGGKKTGGGIASLVPRQNGSQVGTPEDDVVHGLIPTEMPSPQALWEGPLPPESAPAPEEKPLTYEQKIKELFRQREKAREGAAADPNRINWAVLAKHLYEADTNRPLLGQIAGAASKHEEAREASRLARMEKEAGGRDKQLTAQLARLAAQQKAEASEALEWTKGRAKKVGMKAADYNSARKSFLDMLRLGKFKGHTNAKGDIIRITTIDGQSISQPETKRLEKIMSTMFATVASSGIPKAIEEARVALNVTDKPQKEPKTKAKSKVYEKGDIETKTHKDTGEVGKYEYLGPNEWRKVN
tara:strand:- start:5243 stop:7288 length:2046 start_codon:yes stop_codon:yes gene_type:complete